MRPKYEIELLVKKVETTYQVDYNHDEFGDDDDEYLVIKTHKYNEVTWKAFALHSGDKINKSSVLGRRLINFCKKL